MNGEPDRYMYVHTSKHARYTDDLLIPYTPAFLINLSDFGHEAFWVQSMHQYFSSSRTRTRQRQWLPVPSNNVHVLLAGARLTTVIGRRREKDRERDRESSLIGQAVISLLTPDPFRIRTTCRSKYCLVRCRVFAQ